MIELALPYVLLLLVPLGVFGAWIWRRRAQRPRMAFSSVQLAAGIPRTLRSRLLKLPLGLALLCCALLVGAMARPRAVSRETRSQTEGIEIMLVLDVSQSMAAMDFVPNRLEAAKTVVKSFIDARRNDEIGIVIFGRDTFTLAPLTQDYLALKAFVDRIDFDLVVGDRTAIGMGLANAVNQLRKASGKSKVAILLTDGENNAGRIDPLAAAGVAKSFGVRAYTIGVGSEGGVVQMPMSQGIGTVIQQARGSLDVAQLTRIAEETGGKFFRATDARSLERIYGEIDQMEKKRIEYDDTRFYDELGHWLLVPALGLLLLAFLLESTWLRTFP